MKDSAQELQRIQGFEIYGKELYQLALNTDSPVLIMIIGEFSTGKSTFINALVGKEVTTVNDTPTTAVITKLCYGAREQITVYFTDGRAEEHSFSELKVLTAESKTNHDSLHQAIEYVEVAMPIPILQRINIIDSPGLNADKQLHIETTKRYMDKADTVFWMFSATDSPGKQTELEAIKALSPRLKPIAIVNKIDDIDEEEEESIDDLLDNFKSRVRKEVSQVIGISAKLALEGKLLNQRDKIKESNIQAVFDILEHTIIPATDKYKMNSLLESLASFVFHSMAALLIEDDSMSYERQIEVKRNNRTIQNIESRIVAELLPYAQEQYSAGNLSAQMFLGIMTYYGVGIEKDAEQSIDLLESLPSFTSKDGALKEEFLYTHFKGTHEYPKMIYWLKKGADAGRDIAMYRLAECYLDGIGVDINIRSAVSYLVKAYENGSDLAAKKLGLQGTALQITNNTLKLLEIAGEEDCVDAQLQLFKYYNSKPDAASKQKALQWLQEAGTSNSGYAQFKLGEYFSKKHANDAEALKWFKQAFENNYPGALEKICHCYYEGVHIRRNDKEAHYWYSKGANAGVVKALTALGEQYLYGRGIKRNYRLAIQWLKKGVNQNDSDAYYLLAICYKHGRGFKVNYNKYLTYMKKAAALGNVYAKVIIGYLNSKEDWQAQKQLIQLAESGFAKAQFFVGLCREKGIIIDQGDYVKDYANAAKQENDMAFAKLGFLYLHGFVNQASCVSIRQDDALAIQYLKKSASYNNSYAQNILGECYEFGQSVLKNATMALSWYAKAAEDLQKDALCHLSHIYRKGKEWINDNKEYSYTELLNMNEATQITKDVVKANELLEKAALAGSTMAQFELGKMYETGDGFTKNMDDAILWYEKAAKGGNALAQFRLGELSSQDFSKSFEWYLKAAEQGIADAQYKVSLAYEHGKGVKRNNVLAIEWLEKAGLSNHREAVRDMCTYLHQKYGENSNSQCAKWYERGANSGFVSAQVWLGDCYRLGCGKDKYQGAALKWYEKAATKGNVEAMFWAGMLGINQKNNTQAIQWLSTAAEKGNAEAQYVLGKAYYEGTVVPKNATKAISLVKQAASQSHVEAMYLFGNCYYQGVGTAKNENAALKFYRKAAERNHAPAQYMLGKILETMSGESQASFSWYKKAAEQGITEAEYKVGLGILHGMGSEGNKDEAAKWLEKAAIKQHKDATYQLCLLCHSGIRKSDVECFTWYLKGADLGHADVQCWVAECYRLGKGCSQDIITAIQYYNLARKQKNVIASAWWGQLTLTKQKATAWNALLFAASKGDANAQFWLGQYYFQGKFVVKSNIKAVEYFLMATKQVHQGAIFYLGVCRLYGYGIERDYSQAFNCFLKAAQTGNPRAQYMAGKCYEYGLGITHDDAQAFSWYLKAAKNGIAVAQNKVGICYANGKGTLKNSLNAEKWLKEASSTMNPCFQVNLATVNFMERNIISSDLLKEAAAKGHPIAQYLLCCMFHDKKLVDNVLQKKLYKHCANAGLADVQYWQFQKFEPSNLTLLKDSASHGYVPAQLELGKYYYYKQNNKQESFKWIQKAADAGDIDAIYMLACYYWKGEGVEKDLPKAYQLFLKIAAKCKEAEYMIGLCRFNGWGISIDKKEAIKYYRSAGNQNYGEAQNALGYCYYKGFGVEKNIESAINWFQRASNHGSNVAKRNLEIAKQSLSLKEKYRL